MRTNKRPKADHVTTKCLAALCLANTGGDVDKACALASEHVPVSNGMLDVLCQVIRETAETAGIVELAKIIIEDTNLAVELAKIIVEDANSAELFHE